MRLNEMSLEKDLLLAEEHLRKLMNSMKAIGLATPEIKVHAHNLMNVITGLLKDTGKATITDGISHKSTESSTLRSKREMDDLDTGGSESNFR